MPANIAADNFGEAGIVCCDSEWELGCRSVLFKSAEVEGVQRSFAINSVQDSDAESNQIFVTLFPQILAERSGFSRTIQTRCS
jgi:hypothetical protein